MWRTVILARAIVPLAMLGSPHAASAYEVGEVVNGAVITGTVTFEGAPPEPKVFEVQKDPEVCGTERALIEVAVRNGSLKGAVIVLEGVVKGKPFTAQTFQDERPGEGEFRYGQGDNLSLEVRMKKCSFGPLTGVLASDQPVRFLNQDPMKHTIQTFVVRGRKGNILRTLHNRDVQPDALVKRTFSASKLKSSRVIRFRCNRHDFMQNWFYTVETPYFAISDENGHFSIDQVPPGRYKLVAWHPLLGVRKQEVIVTADGHMQVAFEFSGER